MAKERTTYICGECGYESAKWMGKCPQCESWNTMTESAVVQVKSSVSSGSAVSQKLSKVVPLPQKRVSAGIGELDRVLGGGLIRGMVVLLGGDPGIGKSTLMLQVAVEMAAGRKVLYVSGEESERQVKMRALRLLRGEDGADGDMPENLYLVTETNLEIILEHTRALDPDLLVVDSIQTVYLPAIESSAGSVSQVRESASRLRELAKGSGMAVFVIGHVTKEGIIAGPRVLEHIVDTVLYLEGDRYQTFRLLRSVKNRFGATSEVGVFEMRERGMVEVPNPSEAFLAERMVNAPGSAIAVTMEGTRPLLVELQGLTSPSSIANPRRTPNGVDINRLLMLAAVLSRRMGLHLGEQDIFVNVVGGLRITEPAADLAVAAAIASSLRDLPVRADLALIGEVGLSGELRWVGQMNARLREAAKLGFKAAVIPHRVRKSEPLPEGIQVLEARSLREALTLALVKEEK